MTRCFSRNILGKMSQQSPVSPISEQNYLPLAKEIGSGSKSKRLFWLAFLLLCSFTCIFNVFKLVDQYLASELVTNIKMNRASQMTLPSIDICTTVPLNLSKLRPRFSRQELTELLQTFGESDEETLSLFNGSMNDDGSNKFSPDLVAKFQGVDWEQFLLENGPECQEIMAKCLVGRHSHNCCAKTVLSQEFGKCFAFENLSQTEPGSTNGLVITASVRIEEDEQREDFLDELYKDGGLQVVILDPEKPTYSIQKDRITAEAGRDTSIVLMAEEFHNSKQSNPCRTREWMRRDAVLKQCNCSAIRRMPSYNKTVRACFPWELAGCQKAEAVQSACPYDQFEKHMIWVMKIHQSKLRSKQLAMRLGHSVSERKDREYYKIRMYFGILDYKVISEKPAMSAAALISALGGMLSLWLGLNIMNIIRAVAFLLQTCMRRISGGHKTTTVGTSSEMDNIPSQITVRL